MEQNALLELRKFVAPEFIFGPGAGALAGQYSRNLGMERILLVTDEGLIESGWVDMVEESLQEKGLDIIRYANVDPNPRDYQSMEGAEIFLKERCDGILALGGGSPMDCAKGIAIVSTNDQHVLEFEGVDNVSKPGPPLVCIPTTSGSSADISQFAIITDTTRNVKIAIVSKTVVPDASLLDPELTVTMDRDLTIHTGLDALTHAIEAYVSNANSPVTDLFALEAIRLIVENLPTAAEELENVTARAGMMMGSLYAGMAFSNAILGAVHAMAHSLGGLLDLPHGQCNAILLDHVIEYNFDAAPERYVSIAHAMGASIDQRAPLDEKKQATLERVRWFKKLVGMTTTLREIGVRPEDITALASTAILDPCMATNPMCPTCQDIEAIYEKA